MRFFSNLSDLLKKKEDLLQKKEPLFYDTQEFLKKHAPLLSPLIVPLKYERGVFTVGVRSSPALQEFFFLKRDLLQYLHERKYSVHEITARFVS